MCDVLGGASAGEASLAGPPLGAWGIPLGKPWISRHWQALRWGPGGFRSGTHGFPVIGRPSAGSLGDFAGKGGIYVSVCNRKLGFPPSGGQGPPLTENPGIPQRNPLDPPAVGQAH